MSSVCKPRLVAFRLREFPPCSVVCGLLLPQHTHTIHAVVVRNERANVRMSSLMPLHTVRADGS